MKINEVEQIVGISKKNIRFYEQEGLITPKRNADNGYREYSPEDVAVLKEIKLLRKLSISLDEIRKLQSGVYSLQDGMRRQMVTLQIEIDSLYHASLLCSRIEQSGLPLQQLDIDQYLVEMDQLESDGVSFADIRGRDTTRKYIAPLAITMALITLFMTFLYMLFWHLMARPPHIVILLLSFLLPLFVGLAVVLSMLQSIKRAKGSQRKRGK